MAKNAKRHFLEVKGQVLLESNTFQKLSHCPAAFLKVPTNIGDVLKESAGKGSWKDFKLYVRYLDVKAQNPNCGTFDIEVSPRYYQRLIKKLVERGWAWREGRTIKLKAYQAVWRSMNIQRVKIKKMSRFKYWKIPIDKFSVERRIHDGKGLSVKGYLKEIEDEIRKKIARRKRAQIAYALKEKDRDTSRATFSAKSAASVFGYKSPQSGSKLRSKYFSVIPMTAEQAKPRFNKVRGRYEEPTKEIAL